VCVNPGTILQIAAAPAPPPEVYQPNAENIVAISVAGGVAIILAIFTTVALIVRQRERTRREIAAYVAEGTITPEDGERLIRAGREE